MSEDAIVVYGTAWCGDCRRAKKLLERRGIDYAWVDVEEQKGAKEEMLRLNGATGGCRLCCFRTAPCWSSRATRSWARS